MKLKEFKELIKDYPDDIEIFIDDYDETYSIFVIKDWQHHAIRVVAANTDNDKTPTPKWYIHRG